MKKYSVPSRVEEELEPEEILASNKDYQSRIGKPLPSRAVFLMISLIFLVLAWYILRLFQLQVIQGDAFKNLALANQYRSYKLDSFRGIIFDSSGRTLAVNKEVFELLFLPTKVALNSTSQESYFLAIKKLTDLPDAKISTILNSRSEAPLFIDEINDEQRQELKAQNLPSLLVVENNKRFYPNGNITSHLTGYVNEVTKEELLQDQTHRLGDFRGRTGLEQYYDDILKGQSGEVRFSRGADGQILETAAKRGDGLITSIDLSLQIILWQELNTALKSLGLQKAAAVAQDPRSGAVLALVSFPSFDSNSFISGNFSEVDNILKNKNRPLFNRVSSGRLSPGSTIKPLMALAALEEKVIDPDKKILANGQITIPNQYNPDIVYVFRDWKVHGWVDMIKAIANSVDVYFYTIGGGYYDVVGLGIDRIVKYLRLVKIDEKSGIDLPSEIAGFVPTPEWKLAKKKEQWYTGDTYNISIGQGDLLLTPLRLNILTSALANGGRLFKPHIARKITAFDGSISKTIEPELIYKLPVDSKNLNIVREGMRAAVTDGTVWRLKDFPIPIAGKTGSAEVIKGQSTNSWLTAFAPYDNPEIAITVMIERGGHGENFPSQVVKKVFQWYFFKE